MFQMSRNSDFSFSSYINTINWTVEILSYSLPIMLCSYLFTIASLACIAIAQQHNPEPIVNGTANDGWQWFPDIIDATAHPNWVVDEDAGGYLVRFFLALASLSANKC